MMPAESSQTRDPLLVNDIPLLTESVIPPSATTPPVAKPSATAESIDTRPTDTDAIGNGAIPSAETKASQQSVAGAQPVIFGSHSNLCGILHLPREFSNSEEFAVLMLTPGMLSSAGPFRLHVDIAESLAQSGVASLRFDLSGIGESLAIGSQTSSLERASQEITSAIDYLEQHGVKRVGLFGLCSGADDAIQAALNDARVTSVFAMDGCGFPTRKFYVHRLLTKYLPKALYWRKWLALGRRLLGFEPSSPPTLQLGNDIREFPTRDIAENEIATLANRGVNMHFHYTGGADDYYNYAGQFEDMFPALRDLAAVKYSYDPACDHVAFLCEHRVALVNRIVNKMVQSATLK